MDNKSDLLTTEIQVSGDNTTIADVISDRYACMECGEVRGELESLYGQVWDTEQLRAQFDVQNIDPPYAHVVRKADNVYGTIAFVRAPEFYFLFKPTEDGNERKQAQV